MIPIEKAHVEVAAQSHPGMSGKNNEDRFAVSAFQVSTADPTPVTLAIVADGVGGHRAGEVAAELAVEIISQQVAESDARNPVKILTNAIIKIGEIIRDQAEEQDGQKGMGSTCACVWIIGDRLYTASVGDSRIYLIREGRIQQITTDHTWVQEAIEHGALTREQARNHPNVHVIRRYLGSKQPVVPDVRLRLTPDDSDNQAERNQGTHLKTNDRLLICSDGLTDLVKDDEILAALQTNPLEAAVQYLINLANHRGGHDNITVVSLNYTGQPGEIVPRSGSRMLVLGCLGILFLIAVSLATAAWLGWYFNQPALPSQGVFWPMLL
jgi:protein phosphatase